MVVYLYIPTSNHNPRSSRSTMARLYIFIFLHQTTTHIRLTLFDGCCISLYSYIKPQPYRAFTIPYLVVYLYIPTSNHNASCSLACHCWLYIFIFLHQTTTTTTSLYQPTVLYIFIFLHQTTTAGLNAKLGDSLYIFIFLHQTTTGRCIIKLSFGCISLYSYIKPQRR